MTFWQFLDAHPVATVIAIFVVCVTIESAVCNICNACKRRDK